MSDSPVPTPQNDEATTNQQTTQDESNSQSNQKKDTVSSTLDDIFKSVKDAFKKVSERQLVLKNKAGSSVFRLPLVWAIVIAVVSFMIQIVPLIVIAVIVALVTKHQFVIEHKVETPSV